MGKKIKVIIVVAAIALVVITLGIISALNDKVKMNPSGTVGNTAGNLNNGGLFCETEGKVYFSNAYDNGTLYRMNPDGTDIERMLAAKAKFICADGNYIYYYQQSASGKAGLGYILSTSGMFRGDRNLKNVESLSDSVIYDMQLVDNHVYYTTTGDNGPEFRKVKIDKSEDKLLDLFPINPSCAANGVIYYNGLDTNHYLYAMDPNSNASSVVWEGNLWDPIYDNGYIYYMDVENDYRLCRYSLANEQVEILTHDRIDCYNVGGGYIYYQTNSDTAPALKKMNVDGSNAEIVAAGNYTAINMTSRYVYFKMFDTETPIYQVPLGSASASTFDAAMAAAMEEMDK